MAWVMTTRIRRARRNVKGGLEVYIGAINVATILFAGVDRRVHVYTPNRETTEHNTMSDGLKHVHKLLNSPPDHISEKDIVYDNT